MAAFRSGADIVVVAAPEKIALALNFWPDFITLKLKGSHLGKTHSKRIIEASKRFDALLVGNGMGTRRESMDFAVKVTRGSGCKKIIDADAIRSIRLQDVNNSIITPHMEELEVLLRNSGVRKAGLQGKISQAKRILGDNVILLKGKTDYIISKNRTETNNTGNAGMTVGGTGDVLAGVCAGLVAQGNSLFNSACAAAYINGYAGYLLYRKYGYGYTATDLVDKIAEILKKKRIKTSSNK